jgi:hypothetical protein
LAIEIKGTWTGWRETKKDLRKTRRGIERIMAEYDKSNNLYKCLKALRYINTFG